MDTRRMGNYDDASRCIITQRPCLFKRRTWKGAGSNCMFKIMLTAIVFEYIAANLHDPLHLRFPTKALHFVGRWAWGWELMSFAVKRFARAKWSDWVYFSHLLKSFPHWTSWLWSLHLVHTQRRVLKDGQLGYNVQVVTGYFPFSRYDQHRHSLFLHFFFLASVSHFLATNATFLATKWPQMARLSLLGKCASYQSKIGPESDYGTKTRLSSSKSRCRKVPALSEIRTLKVAKKRGGLAKNDICGQNVKNAGQKKYIIFFLPWR